MSTRKIVKIVNIVGARPQFIKAATISRAIRHHNDERPVTPLKEIIIHTGQHFDENMSQVFFEELEIPKADYNLGVGGGRHGEMTGKMLAGIEQILICEEPDYVIVYGDTNSTLAGALAATKLNMPLAHVEAGLRSFNMKMPEEINRILADRISTMLFCPTNAAVRNLELEGRQEGVYQVGDVMYDAFKYYREIARMRSSILHTLALEEKRYVLATCHRAENTDEPQRLSEILAGLAKVAEELPVVLPLHPRTRNLIKQYRFNDYIGHIQVVAPLSFFDMLRLELSAKTIITDSGGVQKEAIFCQVPCVTIRDETEWVETVETGWNTLVGANAERLYRQTFQEPQTVNPAPVFGDGQAANHILDLLLKKV